MCAGSMQHCITLLSSLLNNITHYTPVFLLQRSFSESSSNISQQPSSNGGVVFGRWQHHPDENHFSWLFLQFLLYLQPVFLISLYGASLAQRTSYLALHSCLFWPDGTVNYNYIISNCILLFANWLKMYSQWHTHTLTIVEAIWPMLQNLSKTLSITKIASSSPGSSYWKCQHNWLILFPL